MIAGKVIGSLVSTRKNENLVGSKFMIVEPISKLHTKERVIAADIIGAGIGEYVLVSFGRAARIAVNNEAAPLDAAIVGIIDDASFIEQ